MRWKACCYSWHRTRKRRFAAGERQSSSSRSLCSSMCVCPRQELPWGWRWVSLPVFLPANALLPGSSCRFSAELAMMLWFVVGALFPALLLAAPPPINKLALFPDKSAWCEAKNITQIVGHSGCESKSIQNRACLGQCFSYSVPNTFPQSTESLVHCDSCMPAQSMWEIVTLDCPGNDEIPRVDKLVEKILHCSCQACGKEPSHEGALFNVYLNAEENMPAEGPGPHHYAHHQQEVEEPPASSHHHHEEEGDE